MDPHRARHRSRCGARDPVSRCCGNVLRHDLSQPGRPSPVEGRIARRTRRGGRRGGGRSPPGAHPRRHRRQSAGRRAVSAPRHLPCHPPRTLSRSHGCRPPGPAIRTVRPQPAHRRYAPGDDPRRHQPEEHPARPRRPGVPRCRVRLHRRPRFRSCLLPQPHAAQMSVESGGPRGLSRVFRGTGRRLSGTGGLGAGRCRRAARRKPFARPAPRPCRRQVAGRVHSKRNGP